MRPDSGEVALGQGVVRIVGVRTDHLRERRAASTRSSTGRSRFDRLAVTFLVVSRSDGVQHAPTERVRAWLDALEP